MKGNNHINNKKIPCSVGILTYNSGKTLERLLKDLIDFEDIILCDGGSVDNTLEIGKKYNCKIIQQSNPGQPIEDFSKERNRCLDAATFDWFFYMDSDEVVSKKLINEIREVCEKSEVEYYIYNIPYTTISSDLKNIYCQMIDIYQTRFFNKKCGARFKKKIHERIFFDKEKYKVENLHGYWYVPLENNLNFKYYFKKIKFRVKKMVDAEDWENKSYFILVKRGLFPLIIEILKRFVKYSYIIIKCPWKKVHPVKYEFFRHCWHLYVMYYRIKKKIFGKV